MSRRNNPRTRSLHCRGYDTHRIGEKELRNVFSSFGKVVDVYLPKDYFTKRSRGFAYIQFENEADADAARQKLDRTDIFADNRPVSIMWAAGERKTPTDMRRLDVERDNPHARRERERERIRGGDRDRDWDRRNGRDRMQPRWERERNVDRDDRQYQRDWDRHDRYRPQRRSNNSASPQNRYSNPSRDFDRRRYDRDYEYDRERDYRSKRTRSRTPSPERMPRRRRKYSRSPRSRSGSHSPRRRTPSPRPHDPPHADHRRSHSPAPLVHQRQGPYESWQTQDDPHHSNGREIHDRSTDPQDDLAHHIPSNDREEIGRDRSHEYDDRHPIRDHDDEDDRPYKHRDDRERRGHMSPDETTPASHESR